MLVIIIARMAETPASMSEPESVTDVKEALAGVGYLADEPAALVAYLAQRLGKPVLVEGPAGVGKTELAKALSRYLDRTLVRLHSPELPEALGRRLVEVVHMVRQLDLKKPPSIAESIDWARALMLLGADDIDQSMLEKTMSIIVKHRTDLDVVAERVGVRLGLAARSS